MRSSPARCPNISSSICRAMRKVAAALDTFLARHADEIAGILVEPLVQGAGGMLFHDGECLQRLRRLADKYDLILIFDEIFTGFGRTGPMFACEAAEVVPDIITLGKGLSGGTLPLAATVAAQKNLRRVLVGRSFACADARPDLYGQCARLRRRQCVTRPLRERASASAIGRDRKIPRARLGRCLELPCVKDVRVRGAIGVVELETSAISTR